MPTLPPRPLEDPTAGPDAPRTAPAPAARLEDFIVGDTNRLAYTSAVQLVEGAASGASAEGDDEEVEAKATAKAGQKPVARATTRIPKPATEQWKSAVQAHLDRGLPKAKAASLANREHPGLRQKMLAECN